MRQINALIQAQESGGKPKRKGKGKGKAKPSDQGGPSE